MPNGTKLPWPPRKSWCRRALDLITLTCKKLSEWKSAFKKGAARSFTAFHLLLGSARRATRLPAPILHSVPNQGRIGMQRTVAQTWLNRHIFLTCSVPSFIRYPSSYRNSLSKKCEPTVCWSSPRTLRSSSTPSRRIGRRIFSATSFAKKKFKKRSNWWTKSKCRKKSTCTKDAKNSKWIKFAKGLPRAIS